MSFDPASDAASAAMIRFFSSLVTVTTTLLVLVTSNRVMSDRHVRFPVRSDAPVNVKATLEVVDRFDIDEGPLPGQLEQLLNKHQLPYLYRYRELAVIKGHAVRGRFSLGTALQRILEGTGCSFDTVERSLAVSCDLKADPNRSASEVSHSSSAPSAEIHSRSR